MTGCGPQGLSTEALSADNETSEDAELRELRRKEALADFAQIEGSFRNLYGPLERKEQRYGFRFDDAVRNTKTEINKGKTDGDFVGAMQRFLARFKDGHVSFSVGINSDSSFGYRIPVLVQPFEDKYLVTAVNPQLAMEKNIARGDELISLDGVTPAALVKKLAPYVGTPNPATVKAEAGAFITSRVWYLEKALLPKANALAKLVLARVDGTQYSVEVPWTATSLIPKRAPQAAASNAFRDAEAQANEWMTYLTQAEAEINKLGAAAPFFATPAFVETFKPTAVRPSDKNLADFGTPACAGGGFACYKLYSVIYTHQGKRVLLTRIPSYQPGETANPGTANAAGYFQALFFEFRDQADVLVLDDTHNPGGSVDFGTNVYASLLSKPGPVFAYRYNTDRKWIQRWRGAQAQLLGSMDPDSQAAGKLFQERTDLIETAYDKQQSLTGVIPFVSYPEQIPNDPEQGWGKPFVVLADELSFSGGDAMPMLVKASKQGTVFGARTGGLGGTVELVQTTSATNGELRLTRGLFVASKADGQYVDADFVEDNGVVPDVAYTVKVSDYRGGYVPYAKAFSDVAVSLKPVAP